MDPDPNRIFEYARRGNLDSIKVLVERNPDIINNQDHTGATMLFIACLRGDYDMAFYLLTKGANPNIPNFGGEMPIHVASQGLDRSFFKIVKKLVKYKAKINVITRLGDTPLHFAPLGSNIINYLLGLCPGLADIQNNEGYNYIAWDEHVIQKEKEYSPINILNRKTHIFNFQITTSIKENYKNRCLFDVNNIVVGSPIFQSPERLVEVLNHQLIGEYALSSAFLIRELQMRIIVQQPKHTGVCYFGTKISPLDVLMMKKMEVFYSPIFMELSNNIGDITSTVIVELDMSVYNKYSTVIDGFCLIGCYNLYRWIGYRRQQNKFIITLQIIDCENQDNINNIKNVDDLHSDVPHCARTDLDIENFCIIFNKLDI